MTAEEFAKVTNQSAAGVEKHHNLKNKTDDKDLKIDAPTDDTQNYKPVIIDDDNKNTFRRKGENITVSRLINTKNKIYISGEAKIKPKQQQELDRNITNVLDMLGVKDKTAQPLVAILSENEMLNNAVASYNPIQNIVYVRQALLDYDKLIRMQEQLACPDNKYSTLLHEYIHWSDAEGYRTKNGGFRNAEDYNKYIKNLRNKCKTQLDNAGIDEYNVIGISRYAKDKYDAKEYDEAYTEYRVNNILKE